MARFKDVDWNLQQNANGGPITWDTLHAALLMDLRDELKRLNSLLHCSNFLEIPQILRRIEGNTKKRVRNKKPVALKKSA